MFSTAVSAATRVDPTFDHVNVFKSIGEAKYNAFTATLTKRMTHGLAGAGHLHAGAGARTTPRSPAPTSSAAATTACPIRPNLDREWGVTPFNQTHTLRGVDGHRAGSGGTAGFRGALANNNQLGLILQANSGLPFNIRSRTDLNQDGVTNDRPDGIERNAGRLGRVVYLDLRYSRFVPFSDAQRLELFFEAKNLFNTRERRQRDPRRHHRRRRHPGRAAAVAVPAAERLRPEADAVGGQVHFLTLMSNPNFQASKSQRHSQNQHPQKGQDLSWELV